MDELIKIGEITLLIFVIIFLIYRIDFLRNFFIPTNTTVAS